MKKKPILTVILVAFNEPKKLINKAIDSILKQSFSDFEFLIVNESSNKETTNAIQEKSSSDKRIKVIKTDKVGSFSKSLNHGLKNAKGIYIARMDPDDIADKLRFEIQINFLENNPKYSVVGSAMRIINSDDKIISTRSYPSNSLPLKIWTLFRNPIAHPTVMFRKSIVDKGLFYDENFPKAEDLEFWLRLMKNNFKFYNLKSYLLNYRLVGTYSDKRFGDNFKYNLKARKKNFSLKDPLFSGISLVFAKLYTLIPRNIMEIMYRIIK